MSDNSRFSLFTQTTQSPQAQKKMSTDHSSCEEGPSSLPPPPPPAYHPGSYHEYQDAAHASKSSEAICESRTEKEGEEPDTTRRRQKPIQTSLLVLFVCLLFGAVWGSIAYAVARTALMMDRKRWGRGRRRGR